jgi:hypothetical protein
VVSAFSPIIWKPTASSRTLIAMKRSLGSALLAATFVLFSLLTLQSQEVIQSGPWKLFRQEKPPLNYLEIPTPFVVRDISGTIYSPEDKPLNGAYFEIGLAGGVTFGTDTDSRGWFQLRAPRSFGPFMRFSAMKPGIYPFKVTKDGFHSTIGTIVVSPKAPKENSIKIQLHLGT